MKYYFNNPNQIINMGGPWIGDFIIDNIILISGVVIDTEMYDEKMENIFFIKYHNVSHKQSGNYFTINYITQEYKEYISNKQFEKVFIDRVTDNEVYYFLRREDKGKNILSSLNINNDFSKLK